MTGSEKTIYTKPIDVLAKVAEFVMVVLMVAMVSLVTYQVFQRYVLEYTPPWSEELAVYLMIWFGIIGIPVGVRLNSHMSLHYFADKMPRPVQTVSTVITYLMMIGYVAVLAYEGAGMVTLTMPQLSPAIGLPVGLVYLSLPVAAVLMGIFLVEKLVKAMAKGGQG
ncbi:MAG: TRAP transporter small permease [Negativicutes bacterium]|nr:TRAP transporter small permease [Negativicutes bacterium]